MKEQIIEEVMNAFKELLPDAKHLNVTVAVAACYKDGITAAELKKKTYAFLYPVKEPSLFK